MLKQLSSALFIGFLIVNFSVHASSEVEERKDESLKKASIRGSDIKKLHNPNNKGSFTHKGKSFMARFHVENEGGVPVDEWNSVIESCWKGLADDMKYKGSWSEEDKCWYFSIPVPDNYARMVTVPLELTIEPLRARAGGSGEKGK